MSECVYCGSTERLTRDHVPPKGLFLDPLPDDLTTVGACEKCNSSFSLDDEAFRVFVAFDEDVNEYGRNVFDLKVVGSSFQRSPKLLENVRNAAFTVRAEDSGREEDRPALSIPRLRVDAFLRRLTIGLLSKFHPAVPRRDLQYSCNQMTPSKILRTMKFFEVGDGQFQCWRMVMDAEPFGGLWVFAFYDGPGFVVTHARELGDLSFDS